MTNAKKGKARSRGVSRSVINTTNYKDPKTGFRTTVKRVLSQTAVVAEREKRLAELSQRLVQVKGESPFRRDRCFKTTY